mgnify:CR=1 FL=1
MPSVSDRICLVVFGGFALLGGAGVLRGDEEEAYVAAYAELKPRGVAVAGDSSDASNPAGTKPDPEAPVPPTPPSPPDSSTPAPSNVPSPPDSAAPAPGDSPAPRDTVAPASNSSAGQPHGEDRSALVGKVLCGYQGWFRCPGDGGNEGFRHYAAGRRFEPGHCSIDLWPDVSELDPSERFATPFRLPDGATAEVFSSLSAATVDRHFAWMARYGIDGAMVQRFVGQARGGRSRYDDLVNTNRVLLHCREAANRHGRLWAVMYDLSGTRSEDFDRILRDWKMLRERMALGVDPEDPAYLRLGGKPLVAVWGVGFDDDREYTLDDVERFVRFLKENPDYGGNAVMLGVPTGWRALRRDSVKDERLHELIRLADVVSPWTVGRYRTPDEVARHRRDFWEPDLQWCSENGLAYLPVIFPGFSWHNLMKGRGKDAPLDAIPRLGGRFLWKQFLEAKAAGATAVYVAMFDELDEGTAVMKCTNQPPDGESRFLTYDGLPTDHYLWLCGEGGRLLREELPRRAEVPSRGQ